MSIFGDNYSYVTSKVTEVKAPTDESIRLLREMEDRARKEVNNSVTLNDNKFNCCIYDVVDSAFYAKRYSVVFDLNGTRHTIQKSFPQFTSRQEIVDSLISEVSNYIAVQILKDGFSKLK